jgi:hypothetical protein
MSSKKNRERRPVVLSLIPAGTHHFLRYRIADQYLRYWNGEDWTEDEKKGIVFENSNLACQEMQKLLMIDYTGRPQRTFVAPVIIDLYSDKPVTQAQLQDWLVKVSKLLIDSPKNGNGPIEGSLGLCRIDWTKLEEQQ